MKNRYYIFCLIGTALTSGTLLVNRFVISVPDPVAIIVLVLAVVCFAAFIYQTIRAKKQ